MSNSNQGGLTGLLSNVEHSGEGDEVSVGEMLAAAGPQSYGPLLLLPAAVADIPVIGAIPGVSIVVAVIIVFVAAQLLFALRHPWLPSLVLRLDVSRDKLGAATKRARPWAERLERVLAPRLTFLFEGPFKALLALSCIALALLMVPLAVIPYGVTLPATAVLLLALALFMNDGLVALIGYAAAAATLVAVLYVL